jgi:hypothetical protein
MKKNTDKKTSSTHDYSINVYIDALFPKVQQTEFKTTKKQIDRGIVVCSTCGKMCSFDYKYCSKCCKEVLILK